ncbi:acyl-CoA dehydrogenase family protein, partial [Kibdelosporangium lantanae]
MTDPVVSWLHPLVDADDCHRLAALNSDLERALADHPIRPDDLNRTEHLLAIRQQMADRAESSAVVQVLAQFLCGYHDIDLRDTLGIGHGRLIEHYGTATVRDRWLPRLTVGRLAGIAVTEPHGGSRPAETRTQATLAPDGTWRVTGRKIWISRLTEAVVFTVFVRGPQGELAAVVVDRDRPGLSRQPLEPTGLSGWTWGVLVLDDVVVESEEVLVGDGMTLLREHFAVYRPLVAATALGGAAFVFDTVA